MATELISIDLNGLVTLFPNGFMSAAEVTVKHPFIDVTEAYRKGVVTPGMFGRGSRERADLGS